MICVWIIVSNEGVGDDEIDNAQPSPVHSTQRQHICYPDSFAKLKQSIVLLFGATE